MTATMPLAVTMGEPAGVGGELTLKAWQARRSGSRPFFVLDDPERLASLARRLGIDVRVREISAPGDAVEERAARRHRFRHRPRQLIARFKSGPAGFSCRTAPKKPFSTVMSP